MMLEPPIRRAPCSELASTSFFNLIVPSLVVGVVPCSLDELRYERKAAQGRKEMTRKSS